MESSLVFYWTIFWIGYFNLYSLRGGSSYDHFEQHGGSIGFASIIQKSGTLVVLFILIVGVIKSTWYLPFLHLILGLIISMVISRMLYALKLSKPPGQKSKFGIMVSAILTLISIILLIGHYKNI